MARRIPVVNILFAVLVGPAAFLVAGELAFRVRLNQSARETLAAAADPGFLEDPVLGYLMMPGQHGGGGPRGYRAHVNSSGLRGPEIDPVKPESRLRVVLIGGSVVYGVGSDDEQTIGAYLEQLLKQQLGQDVEVINGGIPGYTSTPEALLLETRLLPLRPDVVIVFDGFNDIYRAAMRTWGAYHVEYRKRLTDWRPGHPLIQAIDAHVIGPSALLYYAQNFYLTRYAPGPPPTYSGPYGEHIVTRNDAAIDLYEHNLGYMASLARQNGARFFVALQPVMGITRKERTPDEQAIYASVVKGSLFEQAVETMYPQLELAGKRAAARAGFPFLSLTTVFDGMAETAYQYDNVHLTPLANRRVAQALTSWVTPLLGQGQAEARS